ncbi:MAG: peptidoglycan-binding protein [bacterium]
MAVYKPGSKGKEVKEIQKRLKALGYYQGAIDGDFGEGTASAVKSFQKEKNLTIDGIVGPTTWKILFAPSPDYKLNINRTVLLESKDYCANEIAKDLIVLHHTVGGTALSTINYWRSDRGRIATAYVVERDGVVYEVFAPKYWAFHLGLKGSGGAVDKRSIGIEIASEGGLIQREGKLYCFGKVSERTLFTQPYYDNGVPWRGYRFFDAYSDAQISSVIGLINGLCEQFKIPRQTPANHFDADDSYRQFSGILGHHHLRRDKSDLHPGFPWQKVVNECRLKLV